MVLAHLRARRFRNLGDLSLDPGSRVCVLFGDNAQGKTNVVEAIHLLSNLQSFRTRRTRDLIGCGFAEALLEGEIIGASGVVRLQLAFDAGGRTARVDGKVPSSISSYLSEFHTVLFSPADIDLARGSQDLRRRYLDRAAFWHDAGHLARLRYWNRVMRHRNACLRRGDDSIDVWDGELARLGDAVRQARVRAAEAIGPVVAAVHAAISGGEQAGLGYCASGSGEPGQEALFDCLRRARPRDAQLGYTTVGPHRDTVRLDLGGRSAERFGSQGQLRTLSLSLKLALLLWGRDCLGEEPVFLLDDPGSELDGKRLGFLGRFLETWSGQVIVAGTDRDSVPLPDPGAARYYRLAGGHASAA